MAILRELGIQRRDRGKKKKKKKTNWKPYLDSLLMIKTCGYVMIRLIYIFKSVDLETCL